MPYIHSKISNYEPKPIDYVIDAGLLPQLNPEATPRIVYETGQLKMGETPIDKNYSVQELTINDAHAIYDLCEAEYKNAEHTGKNYLLRRSKQDIIDMFLKGDRILAVVIDGHLAAAGAVASVLDEGDMGSGAPYDGNGTHPAETQTYFKMLVSHPSLQDKDLGLADILYPHRVCIAAQNPVRDCLLLKTNNIGVCKKSEAKGWEKVDRYTIAEEEYMYAEDDVAKYHYTYYTSLKRALDGIKKKWPNVFKTHKAAIEQAELKLQKRLVTEPEDMTPVNDNHPGYAIPKATPAEILAPL